MDQPLTDDERSTLKFAAYGAVLLVSNAEPGLLAMVGEGFAAARAFAATRGLVRQVLTDGPAPELRRRPPAEVERMVLPALRDAVEILRAKAPEELDGYRAAVLGAGHEVSRAAGGVAAPETAMLDKIREALAGDA